MSVNGINKTVEEGEKDTQPLPGKTAEKKKQGYADDPPPESESRYSAQEDDKDKDYDTSSGERA